MKFLTTLRLILCVCVQSLHSGPTVCDSMDCSPPGSSVCGIFPCNDTCVGCHSLLEEIFPIQVSNPCFLCLLHCRWILSTEPQGQDPSLRLLIYKTGIIHRTIGKVR